jgi:uncharacterized protein
MYAEIAQHAIAFDGDRCIAKGEIHGVAKKVKAHVDRNEDASVLVFDAVTSRIVELDLRGTIEDVLASVAARLEAAGMAAEERPEENRGPGRPKLGVVSREVTLLPRHWEWLERQPGGASVTLRKLVDAERKRNGGIVRLREAQEAVYRFMNAMAGDERGFEEALRALYADDPDRFARQIASWPPAIRVHVETLVKRMYEIKAALSEKA